MELWDPCSISNDKGKCKKKKAAGAVLELAETADSSDALSPGGGPPSAPPKRGSPLRAALSLNDKHPSGGLFIAAVIFEFRGLFLDDVDQMAYGWHNPKANHYAS